MKRWNTIIESAFTLIELLVVIGIISILAAILFPVFARAQEKARQSVCLSNLKQISSAVMMYTQDYDGWFPLHQYPTGHSDFVALPPAADKPWDAGNWIWSTHPYVKNWNVLTCPSAILATGYGNANPPLFYTNYTLNGYLHMKNDSVVINPAETFMIVEGIGSRALDGYGACFPVPFWNPPNPSIYEYIYYIRDGLGINHSGGSDIAFIDGHVKWQPSPGLNGLINHFPVTDPQGSDFNINHFTPWTNW
jgi:prepilin-type N-terminal cleavage/methylation domain-containing protein/prepilin-type processing-associated H-X9-DG protein